MPDSTINSPYPGLRPFQEYDAEYFFGRDSQTKEIIDRLKSNRFVAVLGGSGSGKSSLVMAGAIPKLRSFAIKESGDFWVPVVTTPGTNHIDDDSPIYRLAKKFCAVLKELTPDEEQQRLLTCTDLLRQKNGLDLLIKTFGRDLKNNDGVDLQLKAFSRPDYDGSSTDVDQENQKEKPYLVKVNYLFLIDQFEELFHPSNAAVSDDCRHLVERLIEHFKSAYKNHSPICVAITMRSEHLNDCPRYPDLPDAINASAYLVKRLSEVELREAIERPAKGYLRRQFQQAYLDAKNQALPLPDEDDWPDDIPFDPVIIDKLLQDAEQVVAKQDHADHLPMMQHILYWIWNCAMNRRNDHNRLFPDAIKVEDFYAAIDPSGQTKILTEQLNSLTFCIEQRCEWIFNRFPDRNKDWEEIFRNLAFKEPNTGTYTQRRASMKALCKSNSPTLTSEDELKKSLKPWLGPHQYLFWDECSLSIKVTHESLIRRWKRFRDWADADDRQFKEYLQILEGCTQWLDNNKHDRYLIEGVALRRVEDNKLLDALNIDAVQKRFSNLLKMHRDQCRLIKGVTSAREFLHQSFNKRQQKWIIKKLFFLITPVAILLLCLGLYLWIGAQVDAQQRTLLQSYGMAAETQFALPVNGTVDKLNELQLPLDYILKAVKLREQGKKCIDFPLISFFFKKKFEDAIKFETLSVSRNINGLRKMLVGNAWMVQPDHESSLNAIKTIPSACKIEFTDNDKKIAVKGKKISFYTSKERQGYGLISVMDARDFNTQVYWGFKDGHSCKTSFDQLVYSTPPRSRVGFNANQDSIVVATKKRLKIISIDWPTNQKPIDGQSLPISYRLSYDFNPENGLEYLELDEKEPHISLPTITDKISQSIQVGHKWFRIFYAYPAPTPEIPAQATLAKQDNDFTKKLRLIDKDQDRFVSAWQKKTDSETLYLVINKKDETGVFFGDLYKDGKHNTHALENQKPIPNITNIYLGKTLPIAVSFDSKNGYLLTNSGNSWVKQPYSLEAWAKIANGVYKEDQIASLKKSETTFGYMRANLLLGDEDQQNSFQRLVDNFLNSILLPSFAKN
jgi:hypothetical protein